MTLRALPTMNDLPPLWDGLRVTWGAWRDARSSAEFHLPPSALACHACGVLGPRMCAAGTLDPVPGATVSTVETVHLPSGRTYNRPTTVPAWPALRLFAFRCVGCQHDTVYDEHTGDMWDLDASDYGTDGSRPEGALW